MRTETDETALDFDAAGGVLHVRVTKNGYDPACLDVIARYVTAIETEAGLMLEYPLEAGELPFEKAVDRLTTRLERLELAHAIVSSLRGRSGFKVPVIRPDNLYVKGNSVRVVHSGLPGMLAPMAFDAALFLRSLRAMVLHIFRPKLDFDHLRDGGGALKDPFSTSVWQAATAEELLAFIGEQVDAERAHVATTRVSVSRRRYFWYRVLGAAGVAGGLTAGILAWQSDSRDRLNSAVIAAQARFIANDFAGTLAALEDHQASSLPSSAKYVLAVSSVKLDDLTSAQKQAILNNISEKSDDVTLDYWIAVGRGEFERALDLAQNLGDDQLVLLAYTDLYQATKVDSRMAGAKKQERLEEYAKAIDDLTAKLTGTAVEAADR